MSFLKNKHPSTDPKYIEQRIFAQWSVINSLAFAGWGWLMVCSILFTLDETRAAFSIDGGIFIICGLLIVADIFGIAIFFCNKAVALYFKNKNGTLPDIKRLKKNCYIINAIWFPILYWAGHASYNLFYEFMESLKI